jgi:hypothetical protein
VSGVLFWRGRKKRAKQVRAARVVSTTNRDNEGGEIAATDVAAQRMSARPASSEWGALPVILILYHHTKMAAGY